MRSPEPLPDAPQSVIVRILEVYIERRSPEPLPDARQSVIVRILEVYIWKKIA
jgi:hypothetical protein